MAYGYYSRRRRSYGRRRRYRRRAPMSRSVSGITRVANSLSKLWTGYKRLKGLINVEWKQHTYNSGSVSILETGSVAPLTLIAEGDDNTTRDGKSILAKKVNVQLTILHGGASGYDEQYARFILVHDKDSREAAPSITDILPSAAWTDRYVSDGSKSMKRFQILSDKTVKLGKPSNGMSGFKQIHFNHTLNHHITYDDTTATQNAAEQGHLYLLYTGSQATDNYPTVTIDSRMRFIDN